MMARETISMASGMKVFCIVYGVQDLCSRMCYPVALFQWAKERKKKEALNFIWV